LILLLKRDKSLTNMAEEL